MNSTARTQDYFNVTVAGDVNHTTTADDVMNETTSSAMAANPGDCLVIPPGIALPWENPEDLVAYEVQQIFAHIVNVWLLTILFVIGTPFNILGMVVFCKQGLKERINLCLFCLAFADFMVVLLHFTWGLDWLVWKFTKDETRLEALRVFVNNYLIGFAGFIYASSFMNAVIAVERCFCVLSPLKSKTLIKTKNMACVIVLAWVLITGGHFIIAARWRVVCLYDPLSGVVTDGVFSSAFFFQHEELVNVFDGIVFGIAIPGVCLAAVAVATVITVWNLKKFAAWREQSASSSGMTSRDVTLTRMLIGISVLFIVCTTPGFIFHTAIPFVPDLSLSGRYYNTFTLFINVQQACTYINCSVNFFVYYFFGSKFRETLKSLFRKPRGTSRSLSYRTPDQTSQGQGKT